MGNLNCKTCQCNRNIEGEKDIQPMTNYDSVFNNVDISIENTCAEDKKRKLIEEALQELQNDVNIIYNYKSESNWDLIFNQEDNKIATMNGLLSLKKKIIEKYENFLKPDNNTGDSFKNIIYKADLENIKTSEEFITRFKPLILQRMTNYFKIYDLNKKVKDSNIVISNIENVEKYNLIFKSNQNENFLKQHISIPRFSIIDSKTTLDLNKIEDAFDKKSNRRESILSTKANTKRSNRGLMPSMTAEVFNQVRGLSKRNSTLEVISSQPDEEEKKEEEKKRLDHLIKSDTMFVKDNNDKEVEMHKNKNNKVLIKDNNNNYEINKIQDIYKLEDDNLIFISFKDKSKSTFYEGYWHVLNKCKYGLGIEYHFGESNRYKYFGYFKDNRFHGLGILLKEQNYSYCGEFRNGKQAGYGVEKAKTYSYKGFFRESKYCGFGEYCFIKSLYVGCFYNSQREGIGFSKFEDGCLYIGSYNNNLMHGVGLYRWPEGHVYYGAWKDDKKYGIGYHIWESGHTYLGGYKSDLKDGNGEYTFTNGSKLIGNWINGKKEGSFELLDSMSVYQLAYRNDIQVE